MFFPKQCKILPFFATGKLAKKEQKPALPVSSILITCLQETDGCQIRFCCNYNALKVNKTEMSYQESYPII